MDQLDRSILDVLKANGRASYAAGNIITGLDANEKVLAFGKNVLMDLLVGQPDELTTADVDFNDGHLWDVFRTAATLPCGCSMAAVTR